MSSKITHITEPVVLDRTVQKLNDSLVHIIDRFDVSIQDIIAPQRRWVEDSEGHSYYGPVYYGSVVKEIGGQRIGNIEIPWRTGDLEDWDEHIEYLNSHYIEQGEKADIIDNAQKVAKDTVRFAIDTEVYPYINEVDSSIRTKIDNVNEELINKIDISSQDTLKVFLNWWNNEESKKYYTRIELEGKFISSDKFPYHEEVLNSGISELLVNLLKNARDNVGDYRFVTDTEKSRISDLKDPVGWIGSSDGSIVVIPSSETTVGGIKKIDLKLAKPGLSGGNAIEVDGSSRINVLTDDKTIVRNPDFNTISVPLDGDSIYLDAIDGKVKVSPEFGKVIDVIVNKGKNTVDGSSVVTDRKATINIPSLVSDLDDAGNYYTKPDVDSKIKDLSYTKEQVDSKLGNYFTKTETEVRIGDLAYSKYEIDDKFSEYYTKTATDLRIADASVKHLKTSDSSISILDSGKDRLIKANIPTYNVENNGGLGINSEIDPLNPNITNNKFYTKVDDETVKIDHINNELYVPLGNTFKIDTATGEIDVDPTTIDYTMLGNLPSLNGIEISGDKTLRDYNIEGRNIYVTTDGKINSKNTTYNVGQGLKLTSVSEDLKVISLDAKTSDLKENDGEGTEYKTFGFDKYSKVSETGSIIELQFDELYRLQANLYNNYVGIDSEGTIYGDSPISQSRVINLPLEAMVVDAEYLPDTKEVVLTLKNGHTLRAPLSDLIGGLENTNNKVDSIRGVGLADHQHYPSEKAVAIAIKGIQENLIPDGAKDTYLHRNKLTGELEWVPSTADTAVFYAEYGSTLLKDILNAFNSGKAIFAKSPDSFGTIWPLLLVEEEGDRYLFHFSSVISGGASGTVLQETYYSCVGYVDDLDPVPQWSTQTPRAIQWKLSTGTGIRIDYSDPFNPLIYADGEASGLVDDVQISQHGDDWTSVLDHKVAKVDLSTKQDKLHAGTNIVLSEANVISAVVPTYTAGEHIEIDEYNRIHGAYPFASVGMYGIVQPDGKTIFAADDEYTAAGDPTGGHLPEGCLSTRIADGGGHTSDGVKKGRYGVKTLGVMFPDEKTVTVNKEGMLKALAAPNCAVFYTNDITFRDDDDKKIAYKASISDAVGVTGSMFFDVIDHQLYEWNGDHWQLLPGIYTGTTTPTQGQKLGSIWVDAVNTRVYIWNGTEWQLMSPVWRQATAPSGVIGGEWINSTNNDISFWDGSSWQIMPTLYHQTAQPAGKIGAIWIKTDENKIYIYDGSVWQLVNSYR